MGEKDCAVDRLFGRQSLASIDWVVAGVERPAAEREIITMIRLVWWLIAILVLQSQAIANDEPNTQLLKVGFIMVGPITDLGWNYAHDQGGIFIRISNARQSKTSIAENVPESAEVERVMEKMIAQGNKLIFSTSYGYLEPALRVAARHPDVVIMQSHRCVPIYAKNIG